MLCRPGGPVWNVRSALRRGIGRFGAPRSSSSALAVLEEPKVGLEAEPPMASITGEFVQETELHFPTVLSFLGATIEIGHKHFEEDLRRALGSKVEDLMSAAPVTISPDDGSL